MILRSSRLLKRRELMSVEFDAGNETTREYIHRVEALKQDLILMNEEVSDKDATTALLTGLGHSYQNLVETFGNLDNYTLQQVKVKLTSREERMNQAKSIAEARARKLSSAAAAATGSAPSGSQQSGAQIALFAQGKRQQQQADKGGRGGQKRRRANIRCWNCDKWGHYAYECRAPKRELPSGGPPSKSKPEAPGKAESEDPHEDVAGYYKSQRSKTKGKHVTVIKLVHGDEEPCLVNPVQKSESDVEFYMSFVLDNTSGVVVEMRLSRY
ncbi:gag-polypeptide of LTR copia-type [Phytophthora infestans]|uniref:Gag-polypeptide of LTR copia-type n=1 Tax=Phytophthora infestans TaxID=4787 RepID=A0A833WHL0_PHYIN|nr:gag-polypeptide of LTR copia-type [Phytophthora infestans]KAF4133927.1 gag-polypeptide of LTR copia-type [Phytophthora infestans]